MKRSPLLLLLGLFTSGFLSGFGLKKLSHSPAIASTAPEPATVPDRPRHSVSSPAEASARTTAVKLPELHSTETIESMLNPDDPDLFEKVSLWMLDASEQDVAAYWDAYHKVHPGRSWVEDLIFMNWTRLNPQGAIAATASIPEVKHIPWWGWASHDPAAALAAAKAAGGEYVSMVLTGAGQNQADWVRDHLSELSPSEQSQAMSSITYWQDNGDPKALLDLCTERHLDFNEKTFNALAEQDPWEALDWLKKHSGEVSRRYGDTQRLTEQLYTTLAKTQPGVLERIIAQTPDGQNRRRMDSARFAQLAKTDPEAALEEATATKSAYLANQRMATVGGSLVDSNPDRAFELMDRILKKDPAALNEQGTMIYYANGGSSGRGDGASAVSGLVSALVAKDPARFLESQDASAAAAPSPFSQGNVFSYVANQWAAQDLAGFETWVNGQQDDTTRAKAVPFVVNQALSQEKYDQAAQWVMSMPEDSNRMKESQISNVIGNWYQRDAEACQAWVESADFTDKERENANRTLEMYRSRH